MTSCIAYGFVPEETVTMRGVNNWFLAAMFAGLIFSTVTKGKNIYAVEAFLNLVLCMGGTGSGVLPASIQDKITSAHLTGRGRPKFADYAASTTGGLIRFMLNLAFFAYGVWFAFKGMDGMQRTPCSTYAFFFARMNLFNWYRVLLKIIFSLGLAFYGSFVLLGMPYMGFVGYRYLANKEYRDEEEEEEGDNRGTATATTSAAATTTGAAVGPAKSLVLDRPMASTDSPFIEGDAESESECLSFVNLGISGMLVFYAIAVEFMIKWNRISGVNKVNSTGQLLPLVVGVGGLFRVLGKLVVNLLGKYL